MLAPLPPGVYQLIVHLAYDDEEMRGATFDHPDWGAAWRQNDLELVKSARFRNFLREQRFVLVGWKDLARAKWRVRRATCDVLRAPDHCGCAISIRWLTLTFFRVVVVPSGQRHLERVDLFGLAEAEVEPLVFLRDVAASALHQTLLNHAAGARGDDRADRAGVEAPSLEPDEQPVARQPRSRSG